MHLNAVIVLVKRIANSETMIIVTIFTDLPFQEYLVDVYPSKTQFLIVFRGPEEVIFSPATEPPHIDPEVYMRSINPFILLR